MDNSEFFSLKLKASICGWQSTWDPPETATHWAAIHKCANEMRERVGKAVMAIEAVNADKSLSAEGKRSKKEKIAGQARDELATAASLGKARELAEQQLQRWASKLAAHVKPPADHAEAVLHAQVREKVAGLREGRLAFLKQHAADPVISAALLSAPAFLSGLSETELTLLRGEVEKKWLSAEVIESKAKVGNALTDIDRSLRAAHAMIEKSVASPQRQRHAAVKAEPGSAPARVTT